MALNTRKLGSQGLEVSSLGLGCLAMVRSYGPADEAESVATLHRAIELGCTFLDTAAAYGPFRNEELLGRALEGKRGQVILGTKFGFDLAEGKVAGINSNPDHIRQSVEASLTRLKTDYIDVLYQHRVDPKVPVADVAGVVGELVRQGKVRFFGLCEAGAADIRRAHAVHPVSVLQGDYSLLQRRLEHEVLPLLRELGIGLVPAAPFAQAISGWEEAGSNEQVVNAQANLAAVKTINEISVAKNVKAEHITLAWLLHKGQDIVPVPGAKRRKNLEENVAAAEITLDGTQMAALDGILG